MVTCVWAMLVIIPKNSREILRVNSVLNKTDAAGNAENPSYDVIHKTSCRKVLFSLENCSRDLRTTLALDPPAEAPHVPGMGGRPGPILGAI